MAIASASAPAVVPPLGRLHGFHPGWFGAVMGTAVIGVVAYQKPGSVTSLRDAAHAFGAARSLRAARSRPTPCATLPTWHPG